MKLKSRSLWFLKYQHKNRKLKDEYCPQGNAYGIGGYFMESKVYRQQAMMPGLK